MAALYLTPNTSRLKLTGRAVLSPSYDPYRLIYEPGSGVVGANSYATVAQARAYFVGRRLHSAAWILATADTQAIALKHASALLDAEFTWTGTTPVNARQGLAWPFTDAVDRYGNEIVGVPKAVRDATCELALHILAQDRLVEREGVGLLSLRVDVISMTFDKKDTPRAIPPHVARMLVGYGQMVRSTGTIKNVDLYRV